MELFCGLLSILVPLVVDRREVIPWRRVSLQGLLHLVRHPFYLKVSE